VGSSRSATLKASRPQTFIGVCGHGGSQSWRLDYCVINFQILGCALSTPAICWAGEFLPLDGYTGAVIFQAIGAVHKQDPAVCDKSFH
jgi:hypothetical protein